MSGRRETGFLPFSLFLAAISVLLLFNSSSGLQPRASQVGDLNTNQESHGFSQDRRDAGSQLKKPDSSERSSRKERPAGSISKTLPFSPSSLQKGVITNSYDRTVHLLDPRTNTVYGPYLFGMLGETGFVADAVVSPDGKIGILSNFWTQTLYFIDLFSPSSSSLLGTTPVPFHPCYLCLSPDGKYVLANDWETPHIASIEVASQRVIQVLDLTGIMYLSNPVLAADGKTVLVSDYLNGRLYILLFEPATGRLSIARALDVPNSISSLCVSPDGKTAIGAQGSALTAIRIESPGQATVAGTLQIPFGQNGSGGSLAFSPDGTKAYYLATPNAPDTYIYVLNVTGPGAVSYSGTSIPIAPPKGIGGGAHHLAVDIKGRYAYAGDNWLWNRTEYSLAVVDLRANIQVKSLATGYFPNLIAFPGGMPTADIEVTKSIDNISPYVEDTVVFTISTKNLGPYDGTGILVVDALPEGFDYVSSSAGSGSYDPETGTWDLGNLEADGSVALTLAARVTQPGYLTNVARKQSLDQNDLNLENDEASVMILARRRPDFSDTRYNYEVVDRITARPGQTLTFTVNYKNTGGTATDVVIQNIVDPNLDAALPLDQGTVSGNNIVWNLGRVEGNQAGRVRFAARVMRRTPTGIKIFSRASIGSGQTRLVTTNTVAVTVLR